MRPQLTLTMPPSPPRRSRAASVPEANVLRACLELLQTHPLVAWAYRLNSGTAMMPSGGGRLRPVRFGWKGAPDIIGQLRTGHVLAVECKSDVGVLSEHQERFLAFVSGHGGFAVCVRSSLELTRFLGQLGRSD